MEQVTCICTAAVCGHPHGEPCGNPVENPLPMRAVDRHGQQGPEFAKGLCEACWSGVLPKAQN